MTSCAYGFRFTLQKRAGCHEPSLCYSLMLVSSSIETVHKQLTQFQEGGTLMKEKAQEEGEGPGGCVPSYWGSREIARGKSWLVVNTVHRKEHTRARSCKEWPLGHVSSDAQWTWSQKSGFPILPLPPPFPSRGWNAS